MEKIRLTNQHEYSVIPGGFQMSDSKNATGMLRMILADEEGISFDSVETDFSTEENIADILLLDPNGSAENVVSGYTALKSVEKCRDYLTGHNTTPLEGGGYEMEEIRQTVYVVLLEKPDLQARLEQLQGTVDALVLDALEG